MPLSIFSRLAGLALFATLHASSVRADDLATYQIVLKDHKFTPSEIHVPTGKPFIIEVSNEGDAADEFEMIIPSIEKTLMPGQRARLRMRPLGVGIFSFVGESDPNDEKGSFVSE